MTTQTFEMKGEISDSETPTQQSQVKLSSKGTTYASNEFGEFSYRPVPVLSVVGLILSLLSFLAIFVWQAMPLCFLGFLFCGLGLWTIIRSDGAYGGWATSIVGLLLAPLFAICGISLQLYMYQTEVPDGYHRLNFVKDISDLKVVEENGKIGPPPRLVELDGKKVFLKGYIYQTKQTENLHSFLFVKDNQSCCFGANPEIWDRLGVVMDGEKTINYHAGRVAVAGTFRLNPEFNPEGQLEPLYVITADHFTTRISDF
ncbi:hypothetical protein SH668x_001688 [Planctomicrobium sp. SH668]|uniref:hypothetical protein n=1 Tax=Planctomicrobium sp. SH668 TaxID=3448126 RepID=UPI003F5C60D6